MLTLLDLGTLRSGNLVKHGGAVNASGVGGSGEGNDEGSRGTHFDWVVLVGVECCKKSVIN
jgi:hypothetical protein